MLTRLSSYLLVLCVGAVPALAQTERPPFADVPKLEITGRATEQRTPDRARVSLRVQASGPTSEGVSREVAVAARRVADAIKSGGIDDAETSSDGPTVSPVYETTRDGQGRVTRERPRLVGYTGVYSLGINTGSLDALEALVPSIGAAGGLVQGFTFFTSDPVARNRELELRAIAEGVERAGRLIRAAGGRPGRVLSIESGPDSDDELPSHRKSPAPVSVSVPRPVTIPVRPGKETATATAKLIIEILPLQP